jgi:hypothetical protein
MFEEFRCGAEAKSCSLQRSNLPLEERPGGFLVGFVELVFAMETSVQVSMCAQSAPQNPVACSAAKSAKCWKNLAPKTTIQRSVPHVRSKIWYTPDKIRHSGGQPMARKARTTPAHSLVRETGKKKC